MSSFLKHTSKSLFDSFERSFYIHYKIHTCYDFKRFEETAQKVILTAYVFMFCANVHFLFDIYMVIFKSVISKAYGLAVLHRCSMELENMFVLICIQAYVSIRLFLQQTLCILPAV
jgi:hypothetical protein